VLIAPVSVGRGFLRGLADDVLAAAEDHDEGLLGVLRLQEEHLLAITRGEPSLGFQDQVLVIVEGEVGQVVPLRLGLDVRELVLLALVLKFQARFS
jgi:hypothetical protein